MIADIHFNYTLALKAIDAGAHCIRINPGNIGGHDKVGEVVDKARAAGVPMRIGVNSGSLPKHLHELERENPVEALVAAAIEHVELMDRLDFEDFKVSIKSTNVPNTIASNRLLSQKIDNPLHLGITEAGHQVVRLAQVGGRPRHAAGRRDRRHDPHLALHLPRRGGGQGRLGDPQGAQAARARPGADRLPDLRPAPVRHGHGRGRDRGAPAPAYDDPIEVAVLGCAVNGIGEASHADFGITGAKNEGLIFAHGKPLRKVPQDELVDELFAEIDKSIDRGPVVVDEREAAEGAAWLEQIEEENAGELTPERIAAMEAAAATEERSATAGAADGRRAEGQADHARRGRLADGGAPLHAGLPAEAARGAGFARPSGRAGSRGCGAPTVARGVEADEVLVVSSSGRWQTWQTGRGVAVMTYRNTSPCAGRSLAITLQNASTTIGSNCVPAQRRSSSRASASLTDSR